MVTATEQLLRDRQQPPWSPGWAGVLVTYLEGLAAYPHPFVNPAPVRPSA